MKNKKNLKNIKIMKNLFERWKQGLDEFMKPPVIKKSPVDSSTPSCTQNGLLLGGLTMTSLLVIVFIDFILYISIFYF